MSKLGKNPDDLVADLRAKMMAELLSEQERGTEHIRQAAIEQLAQEASSLLPQADSEDRSTFEHIGNVLIEMTSTELPAARAQGLIDCARYFYRFGEGFTAIPFAEQARALSRIGQEIALEQLSNCALGGFYNDTGNSPRAIECLAVSLRLSKQLNDRERECSTWGNIAAVLQTLGSDREAIAAAERAINLSWCQAPSDNLSRYRFTAQGNIMLSALHLKDYERGLAAAKVAFKDIESANIVQKIIFENIHVRLLLATNQIDRAAERCQIAEALAAPLGSIRTDLQVAIALGLTEVYRGKRTAGLNRLANAYGDSLKHRPAYIDVLRALIDANHRVGKPKAALQYVREWAKHSHQVVQAKILRHAGMLSARLERETLLETPPMTAKQRRVALLAEIEATAAKLRMEVVEEDLKGAESSLFEHYAVAAELTDDETGEHCYRVGRLAALLADEFGCDEQTIDAIELAARLHDLGKVGVSHDILRKPGKLNEEEQTEMRQHTLLGAQILTKFELPALKMAGSIARSHHEWWNGSGYPDKLAGEAIPLAARFTALADVFDALTHKRPYKQAWPVEAAVAEIKALSGKQFDPQLTDLFLSMIVRLHQQHGAKLDDYLAESAKGSTFLTARQEILAELDAPLKT